MSHLLGQDLLRKKKSDILELQFSTNPAKLRPNL